MLMRRAMPRPYNWPRLVLLQNTASTCTLRNTRNAQRRLYTCYLQQATVMCHIAVTMFLAISVYFFCFVTLIVNSYLPASERLPIWSSSDSLKFLFRLPRLLMYPGWVLPSACHTRHCVCHYLIIIHSCVSAYFICKGCIHLNRKWCWGLLWVLVLFPSAVSPIKSTYIGDRNFWVLIIMGTRR